MRLSNSSKIIVGISTWFCMFRAIVKMPISKSTRDLSLLYIEIIKFHCPTKLHFAESPQEILMRLSNPSEIIAGIWTWFCMFKALSKCQPVDLLRISAYFILKLSNSIAQQNCKNHLLVWWWWNSSTSHLAIRVIFGPAEVNFLV